MASQCETDWTALRAHFPLLSSCVYLDTATFGPLSTPAAKAAQDYYDEAQRVPGEAANEAWYAKADVARGRVAALIGATPGEIGFAPNTSTAMTCAALLFEDQGGAVLVGRGEHPSVVTPWYARRYRVDVAEPGPDGLLSLESYERALRPDTRALCVSHVRFNDGQVADLAGLGALCRARAVHLVVDAIQSLPNLPLDVACGADIVGFAGFKWLNAGHGAGAIYVRDGLMARYGLPIAGRRSRSNMALRQIDNLDPLLRAQAFELGAMCMPGVLSLSASLQITAEARVDRLHARVANLTGALRAGLKTLGLATATDAVAETVTPIISVAAPDPEAAHTRLLQSGVHVALRGGRLRIAVSWYNNADDIARCLGTLEEVVRR